MAPKLIIPVFNSSVIAVDDLIRVSGAGASMNYARIARGTANQVFGVNAAADGIGYRELSAIMDSVFGSAQGSIAYRDTTVWTALSPGTSGQFLKTQGSGANPLWADVSGSNPLILKVKTADEDVASSTVLQDDDDLFMTLSANTDYDIVGWIRYLVGSLNGLKFDFDFSGTVTSVHYTFDGSIAGGSSFTPTGFDVDLIANSDDTVAYQYLVYALGTDISFAPGGSESKRVLGVKIKLKVGLSGGVLKFRWAQNTSDPDGSTVQQGSYILARVA